MKTLLAILLLFILPKYCFSAEDLEVKKYKALKFMGPNTNPKAAAEYTEKTYTLPAYKLAVNAYKQLKILAKKKELNKKQLKLATLFKAQIHDYKLWLKLGRLYHAAHFATMLESSGNGKTDRSGDRNAKRAKNDPITAKARSLSIKISNQISSFFDENKHLTEKKGFVHPARASYNVFLRNPMKDSKLDQKVREDLLKHLQTTLELIK